MGHTNDSAGKPRTDADFRLDLPQEEFDREFFGRVLRQGDSNTDVLRRQAELLARLGDYTGALVLDRTLVERCPEEPVAHYNLACSLSMNGEHRAAVGALARAIDLGYDDFVHIEADADLDPLRTLASFLDLLRRNTDEKRD